MANMLPLSVQTRPPEYSPQYRTEVMLEPGAGSYWCTPAAPRFPVAMDLRVRAREARAEKLRLDTRVPGWETSGARELTVEFSPFAEGEDDWQLAAECELEVAAVHTVLLAAPMSVARVRLTFHSNHGGNYLALAGFSLVGIAEEFSLEAMVPPRGERVTARGEDGEYRPAIVADAGCLVRWEDGSEPSWVSFDQLRRGR